MARRIGFGGGTGSNPGVRRGGRSIGGVIGFAIALLIIAVVGIGAAGGDLGAMAIDWRAIERSIGDWSLDLGDLLDSGILGYAIPIMAFTLILLNLVTKGRPRRDIGTTSRRRMAQRDAPTAPPPRTTAAATMAAASAHHTPSTRADGQGAPWSGTVTRRPRAARRAATTPQQDRFEQIFDQGRNRRRGAANMASSGRLVVLGAIAAILLAPVFFNLVTAAIAGLIVVLQAASIGDIPAAFEAGLPAAFSGLFAYLMLFALWRLVIRKVL